MTQTVVVTGAGGFIGRALADACAARGWRVIAWSSGAAAPPAGVSETHHQRLPDATMAAVLRKEQPRFLLHCAGPSSVAASFTHQEQDFADTVLVTRHVLNAVATASPATRVVFLSSAAVLGEPALTPTNEQARCHPVSPYGFHKWMAEILCREFFTTAHVRSVVARVFSVYGPGLDRRLLWDVAQQWVRGDEVVLDGDGRETRDWITIGDLVRAMFVVLDTSAFEAECVHIGAGRGVTVAELATHLMDALGQRKPLRFTGVRRAGDPRFWQADNARLTAMGMSGWQPLEEGLREYAAWVRTR